MTVKTFILLLSPLISFSATLGSFDQDATQKISSGTYFLEVTFYKPSIFPYSPNPNLKDNTALGEVISSEVLPISTDGRFSFEESKVLNSKNNVVYASIRLLQKDNVLDLAQSIVLKFVNDKKSFKNYFSKLSLAKITPPEITMNFPLGASKKTYFSSVKNLALMLVDYNNRTAKNPQPMSNEYDWTLTLKSKVNLVHNAQFAVSLNLPYEQLENGILENSLTIKNMSLSNLLAKNSFGYYFIYSAVDSSPVIKNYEVVSELNFKNRSSGNRDKYFNFYEKTVNGYLPKNISCDIKAMPDLNKMRNYADYYLNVIPNYDRNGNSRFRYWNLDSLEMSINDLLNNKNDLWNLALSQGDKPELYSGGGSVKIFFATNYGPECRVE
jgi:hypothetical protein